MIAWSPQQHQGFSSNSRQRNHILILVTTRTTRHSSTSTVKLYTSSIGKGPTTKSSGQIHFTVSPHLVSFHDISLHVSRKKPQTKTAAHFSSTEHSHFRIHPPHSFPNPSHTLNPKPPKPTQANQTANFRLRKPMDDIQFSKLVRSSAYPQERLVLSGEVSKFC